MARTFHLNGSRFWRKWSRLFLALSWMAGLIVGSSLTVDPVFSTICMYAPAPVVRLFVSVFFPFLLSASVVLLFRPRLLPVLGFLRAALYGYVELGICRSLGTGAFRWLLFFGQSAALPVFYWVLLHHVSGERPFRFWNFFFLSSLIFLIGSMDYCVISPLAVNLIDL